MKSKILGHGEIGKSLQECYQLAGIDVAWKDLIGEHGDNECQLLNVAIPYGPEFIPTVLNEIRQTNALFVVIHSTVAPGTTATINNLTNAVVVHSPVIGVHPNLTQGILTFKKWIGSDEDNIDAIIKHFNEIGISRIGVVPSVVSEKMKLLDTTYYGLCLAFNAEARDWLGENYTDWVEYLIQYNTGYCMLNMPNVRRPYFERLTTPIGGHCIMPNVEILEKCHPMPALEQIKKYGSQ